MRRNFSPPWTVRKGTISSVGGEGSPWRMAVRRGHGYITTGDRALARAQLPMATIGGSARRADEAPLAVAGTARERLTAYPRHIDPGGSRWRSRLRSW